MNLVEHNILQLVENFLRNWKDVLELKNFLPSTFNKLLEEGNLDKIIEKIVESSNYTKFLLTTSHNKFSEWFKKETLEEIIKPEIKLIIWFLSHPKNFLDYLFEQQLGSSEKLYKKALYYFNMLKF